MSNPIGYYINTDLAKALDYAVGAGWANQSDGSTEALGGAFALVTIESNELSEFRDIYEDVDDDYRQAIRAGYFVTLLDSNGNKYVYEYPTEVHAKLAYLKLESEYNTYLISTGRDAQ